ncbi:Aldo_ket_red domain-containing protein, partial [Cephalotus follicularis]
RNLGMQYVDMYLVHWPFKLKPGACSPVPNEEDFDKFDLEATWAAMERCLEVGLCRGIGVSNFSSKKIECLLDFASIPPAINQVEMHPMWRQRKLREVCAEHMIHVSAYSPLGGPGNAWGSTAVVQHPVIQSIALKHEATPAQVALKWGLSKGSSVIVKSFNEKRMKENKAALNLKLDHKDFLEIEKLEERKIMRGEYYVNDTTSPYKTIQDLWDNEI